jgi:predicted permease
LLVVGQAALSLALLACAGLLVTSLRNLEHQDLGFATANRVLVEMNPPLPSYTPERLDALYRAIEDRLLQLPNVQSVSFALYSPLSFDNWGENVAVEGKGDPSPGEESSSSWDRVSHNYFATVGQNVVRGRDFEQSDNHGSRPVAMVNQAFVKRFFPSEDPLGRHFGMNNSKFAGDYEIVGVVRDAKYIDPEKPARPMFFLPLEQSIHYDEKLIHDFEAKSHFVSGIQLRLRGSVTNLEPQLRRALAEIDPNLTIISVTTMDEQVAMNFDQERMVAQLAGTFGVIALLLAGIGLYGLTAYTVVRRTSEIGVRMALGADRMNIVRLVLRGAFLQVAIGLLIGVPLAIGAGRLMTTKLFGVRSWDPKVFGFAVLALGLCAAVASVLPAQRAASTDPVKALRAD